MAKTKKNQPKLHTAITGKRWWQEVAGATLWACWQLSTA